MDYIIATVVQTIKNGHHLNKIKIMKNVLLYLWQLPQNLLGLILIAIYKPEEVLTQYNGNKVYFASKFPGGISLGKYAIVSKFYYYGNTDKLKECSLKCDTVMHESIGHAKQSLMLGPLYLIVIGLPSIIWAWLYGPVIKPTKNGYYRFYTEKWADKLADIKRK